MSPACDHLLCSLSEYGLLGFSPTEAIADTWHMALMKTIYICGAEVMENPQRKALSLKSKELIPVWYVRTGNVTSADPDQVPSCELGFGNLY